MKINNLSEEEKRKNNLETSLRGNEASSSNSLKYDLPESLRNLYHSIQNLISKKKEESKNKDYDLKEIEKISMLYYTTAQQLVQIYFMNPQQKNAKDILRTAREFTENSLKLAEAYFQLEKGYKGNNKQLEERLLSKRDFYREQFAY